LLYSSNLLLPIIGIKENNAEIRFNGILQSTLIAIWIVFFRNHPLLYLYIWARYHCLPLQIHSQNQLFSLSSGFLKLGLTIGKSHQIRSRKKEDQSIGPFLLRGSAWDDGVFSLRSLFFSRLISSQDSLIAGSVSCSHLVWCRKSLLLLPPSAQILGILHPLPNVSETLPYR
jgi:hypothetical protein